MTHPNCPPRLARLYKRLGESMIAVARDRGVNIKYVFDAIHEGKAPSVKNTEARTRLYFPKTDRKPAGTKQKTPTPAHWNWWRHLTTAERDEIMKHWFDYAKGE